MENYQGKTKQSIEYSIGINLLIFLTGSILLFFIILKY